MLYCPLQQAAMSAQVAETSGFPLPRNPVTAVLSLA